MIHGQNSQAYPNQSLNSLVVKRTFLEFEGTCLSPDAKDGKSISGLRYVASDPAMYDMVSGCDTPLDSVPLNSDRPDGEFVLTGLDDEETESVITSTTDEPHSETSSSFASQDTARSVSKERPQSQDSNRLDSSTLDRLAAENARLARENLELRQECLGLSSAPAAQPSHCPIHYDTPVGTPEMLASAPMQSLESLPTFALPEAMQPESMPHMDALPVATSGATVMASNGMPMGFFPANCVWVPMEFSMPVAPATSNNAMFLNQAQQSIGAKATRGKRGARAARAEQMFAKHADAVEVEAPARHLPRAQNVPLEEPLQETQHHDEFDESCDPSPCPAHLRTTVMLRNLPNNYTRAMLLDLIDSEGYAKTYDFMYLPIDFNSKASLGYAFVNFCNPNVAQKFRARFHGFSNWILPSRKVCIVNWSGPHQGLEAHIERYRNSPVMHEAVPDIYKPVLFADGKRTVFPAPTKKLRAPRIRYFRNGQRGGADFQSTLATSTHCDDSFGQPGF